MHEEWVEKIHPKYQRLTTSVTTLLDELLKNEGIDYLSVSGRTKTKEGILEKINRKEYKDPSNQLTDLAGIRVITFLESGVDQASQLIRKVFDVDDENSLDKSDLLGVDQIGYRSVHFVCRLSQERLQLPEFKGFKELIIEIQIRTVLQHAWAELAHDRSYKFSGVLPKAIQRKLHLYAGMLELADAGFEELASQIDNYSIDVGSRAAHGDLDIEINTLSLLSYLPKKIDDMRIKLRQPDNSFAEALAIELLDFGLRTLKDIEGLFTKDFMDAIAKSAYVSTTIGVLREAMMFSDIDQYFSNAWKEKWNASHAEDDLQFMVLKHKYSVQQLKTTFESYDVYI